MGVLGGTFDPPHYGHLALAETARVQLELERVLFVPAGRPPHKPAKPISPGHHRRAMVELAIQDNPHFALSCADLGRPGPHYTVRTLALLREMYPKATLFFLMGEDSLSEFHTWREPARILEQAHLAVMRRQSASVDWAQLERIAPDIRARVSWLDIELFTLSSTTLRRRVRRGLPTRYMVPPGVELYVREQQLYLEEQS
jgi:nicotinate-nucleotide adenylyltransferase